MNAIAVITTVSNIDEARAMARALVERQLAACVQITAIESLFYWEQTVQSESEYRLLCKTTRDRYAELEQAILELHSYELPAIYALPLEPIYPPFAQWVASETQGQGKAER